jgi:ubiquinone/menaquinone biosynthesis C-methylase UbiE
MNHREYFNQLAGKWDRMTSEETRSRLPELIQDLRIKSGDTVLDVGGGTGILLPLLCKVAGNKSKIISLDIAEEMLKQARNTSYPSSIHYVHADVVAIPLASETLDLVICYSCFPHFPDKPKALAEMARVLRSCGRLVICHTASRHEINELHESIGDVIGKDFIPDEATMRDMLTASGLKTIEVRDEAHRYLAIAAKG